LAHQALHTVRVRPTSRRQQVLIAITLGVSLSVIQFFIGPTYLEPLPISAKLILAAVLLCMLAALAIYFRRRGRPPIAGRH